MVRFLRFGYEVSYMSFYMRQTNFFANKESAYSEITFTYISILATRAAVWCFFVNSVMCLSDTKVGTDWQTIEFEKSINIVSQ